MFVISNKAYLEAVGGGTQTIEIVGQKLVQPIEPMNFNASAVAASIGNAAMETFDAVKKAADNAAKAAANVAAAAKNLTSIGASVAVGNTLSFSVCTGNASASTGGTSCRTLPP